MATFQQLNGRINTSKSDVTPFKSILGGSTTEKGVTPLEQSSHRKQW